MKTLFFTGSNLEELQFQIDKHFETNDIKAHRVLTTRMSQVVSEDEIKTTIMYVLK